MLHHLLMTNKIRYLVKKYIYFDTLIWEHNRWIKDRGETELRLNYENLNSDSRVLDIGGYRGDFAYEINQKFGCSVYVFEPHPVFFEIIKNRFKNNSKIKVYNFGLSDRTGTFELSDADNSSSTLKEGTSSNFSIKCEFKEIHVVLDQLELKEIDLIKINIEGGEYDLLEHISSKGGLAVAKNYQIQFHNFVDDAKKRRSLIQKKLGLTHKQDWCYDFVWESWVLKDVCE